MKNYQIVGIERKSATYLMKVQKKGLNLIYNLIKNNLVITNIKGGIIRKSRMGDDYPIVWTLRAADRSAKCN